MADPALGTKQVCPNDQTKFYDLNRRPATCPKCGFQFDPEEALKSRVRSRARTPAPNYEEQEDEVEKKVVRDEEADELDEADAPPEIDQAADADPVVTSDDEDVDPDATPAGGDDLGVDFEEEGAAEDDEDVPFLEDEDDDFDDDDLEGLPDEGGDEDR